MARPVERSLPSDLAAEAQVLGSCLVDPSVIPKVSIVLRESDFFAPGHRAVWHAIEDISNRGDGVDVVGVVGQLRANGTLETVGGPLAVADLQSGTALPANAPRHAATVVEAAKRRSLLMTLGEIQEQAWQPGLDVGDAHKLAAEAEVRVTSLLRDREAVQVTWAKNLVSKAMDDAERGSLPVGTPWGFHNLDRLTGGMHAGNLIVLAARPGLGKSSLALNVARNVAVRLSKAVLFYSLEMSESELGMRLLCAESGVSWSRVRGGHLADADYAQMWQAQNVLDAPLLFVDNSTLTLSDIRTMARIQEGLGLIVLDYLQLMAGPGRSRQEEVANLSRTLKLLAKELDLPVLLLSQLNRNPESRTDKHPTLGDLRESGAIEQDADIVVLLHKLPLDPDGEQHPTSFDVNAIVAKNRNGPTGDALLRFNGPLMQFSDPDHSR